MAIIGFDDQVQRPDGEEKKLSGEETFKIVKSIEDARKNLYLSPERLAKMEATYGVAIVHDFDDEYHLTDEEREAQNNYYKLFARLNKCKRKYRKINEFVDCARISMQCLQAVADNNTVYKPEEFMRLVLKGKIVVNGWFYPKYNGRDRKQISWDYIADFILGDHPSEELLKQKSSEIDFLTPDELEEEARILFDPDEYERILEEPSLEHIFKNEVHVIDLDEEEVSIDSNLAIFTDKSDTKEFVKAAPELLILAKDIRREMKSNEQLGRYISDIRMDDIETIEAYDNRHSFVSDSDMPVFTGDITKNKDYHKYMAALEEYENTQIKENYNGKMRTREEIREIQLKETLESAGWNIRVLYDNQLKEKKLEKARKADKKREKKLKEQLTKVQNRSKRRMGLDVDDEVDSGKKKKKKKKKKIEDDD
jgi:hypothetical protein